jgi:citrate lyase subunit alpha / citrate CoA-transferase
LIDVIVTERGICINPKRKDLIEAVKGSGLPVKDIHDLQKEIYEICGGKPNPPKRSSEAAAVVKWVDGTVIDSVWKID